MRALLAPGRGRGSSVSSLVCYLIGLSHIDPIANRLTLGRFLHEDLRGLPDIDLDFPRDIREVLIPRVHERFGRERAALVAAFPTFRARGAIRELGKVLGLPPGRSSARRAAPSATGRAEHDMAVGAAGGEGERRGGRRCPADRTAIARGGQRRARSERWRWLARLVEEAYGLPRHLSQHSGGMIVATRPLIDCCPVVPAAMEGRQMVQWDKDSCSDAGFLKIDLLGLGMLSAVERCVETIARARASASTSRGSPSTTARPSRRSARRTRSASSRSRAARRCSRCGARGRENLDDLTVQVAIIRPGPIQGGAVNPYIERRRRLREDPAYEIPYDHPALEPVLRDTLGTIIFQDQVMEVAEAFAGFTPGEADGLRRAMSRKRSQRGAPAPPRALRAGRVRHAGAEPGDGGARVADGRGLRGLRLPQGAQRRLRPARLPVDVAARALRRRVPVRAAQRAADGLLRAGQPRARGRACAGSRCCASTSTPREVECAVQDGGVRLGLGYIKDVAGAEMRELVAERERSGPFRSLGELAGRIGARRGRSSSSPGRARATGLMATRRGRGRRRPAHGVVAARDGRRRGRRAARGPSWRCRWSCRRAPRLRSLGRWQRLIADYATSGVTVGDHAMAILRERLTVPMLATSAQLARLPNRGAVAMAGLVIARQRPGNRQRHDVPAVRGRVGNGQPDRARAVYERHRYLARAEPLLLARGRVERSEGVVNLIVRELAR